MRYLEPGSVNYRLEVDDTHDSCKNITADNAEENRDDAHEAAEGNGADNADRQCEHRNSHVDHVNFIAVKPAMLAATGASSRPITAMIAPIAAGGKMTSIHLGAYAVNNQREKHEQQTENDKAGLCMVMAEVDNQQYRRDKGKAGAEIGRNFALGDEKM